MKKTQLKNIIRESIKQLLTEQSSPQTGWDQVWCGTPPPNTTWPPCGIYTHLNYRLSSLTACHCNDYNASTGTCSSTPFTIGGGNTGVTPGGQNNPQILSVGDTFHGNQANPPAGSPMYVVMSITPWGCNPNDPGVNSNPSNCPQGFGSQTLIYPQATSCYNTTSTCDTTPASACATQWFGPNASNFTAWMASKDCSNYQSVVNNLETQANALMTAAPTPQSGPYSDWNAIKNAANASGLGQPQKGQFKRKMAKAMYSQCQIQACNC